MHVLGRFREIPAPQGLMLVLQVIRPHPVVETGGHVVCEIEGGALFRTADPAAAQVDAMIGAGLLAEEAVDDHVLKHYSSGAALVDDFADSRRDLPAVRERCRTRRLRSIDRS